MSWTSSNPVSIGDATKKAHYDALWDNALYLMSPFTAAGKIPYATGANAIAGLTIGAANYKLFTNAGANAPEWANGIKIISGTRALDAATADVSYTTVGFKPSAAVAIATVDGADRLSIGFFQGTSNQVISQFGAVTYHTVTSGILIYDGETGKNQLAAIKTWDADGFTLTWTRTGNTGAGTIKFSMLCFR
jgi:hypothetical protein